MPAAQSKWLALTALHQEPANPDRHLPPWLGHGSIRLRRWWSLVRVDGLALTEEGREALRRPGRGLAPLGWNPHDLPGALQHLQDCALMTGSADNARGKGWGGGGEAKDGVSDGVLFYSVLTVCVSESEQRTANNRVLVFWKATVVTMSMKAG